MTKLGMGFMNMSQLHKNHIKLQGKNRKLQKRIPQTCLNFVALEVGAQV
jgi:hypothetical protein